MDSAPDLVTKEGKCTICGKVFSNNQNARRHVREMHFEKPSDIGYKCHLCGSTYGRNRAFREHMAKTHGINYKNQQKFNINS